jgi:hypothetical protein
MLCSPEFVRHLYWLFVYVFEIAVKIKGTEDTDWWRRNGIHFCFGDDLIPLFFNFNQNMISDKKEFECKYITDHRPGSILVLFSVRL